MRTSHLLPLFIGLLAACSTGTPGVQETALASNIERVVVEEMVNGSAGTIADLSIDGMSCEMMCGGSIKKALAKLPGVNSTEIRFIEGDESDHAVVDYDASKVSDADMVEAIQSLHDGQYKVVSVHITKRVPSAGGVSASTKKAEETKQVSVINPTAIVVPGILGLLSYVLRL
ncbi:MAG TPA: heavy metal-associated domain-containing protein [Flavobacteriales bacterium]|nr:heavy metal-associated domain-containing protein [Flavobacteriales bacterium]HNU57100.1 heavy metal-associated domain-containing protein [Flavobacteriales bacterium]